MSLRVAILTHEDLIPPDTLKGHSEQEIEAWATEWDVMRALRELKHEARFLGVSDDLRPIRQLVEEWQPHVVFNLLMEFRDVGAFQVHVASYLELLGVPTTGCNSRGILLARDKAVSKQILRYHHIPTPNFRVFSPGGRVRAPKRLGFPLIVKSVDEEASLGIAQASVVRSEEQLQERVKFIHEKVGSDALAEQYVDGRELTISVLGNTRLETFPVWEMEFRSLPEGTIPIATDRAKHDLAYQKKLGIHTGPARDLPEGAADRIASVARRIYRALGLSGYARIDLRLAPDGRAWVLEANATPDVQRDEDLARSAKTAGVAYPDLIQRILDLGTRYRPQWKRA
jgi:D-alanine-D-alanine ligase